MNAHDMGAVTVNECLVGECDSKNSIFPSCFPCMFRYGIPKEKKKKGAEEHIVPFILFLPWALLELFVKVVWQLIIIFPPLSFFFPFFLGSFELIPTLIWSVLVDTYFMHPPLKC